MDDFYTCIRALCIKADITHETSQIVIAELKNDENMQNPKFDISIFLAKKLDFKPWSLSVIRSVFTM